MDDLTDGGLPRGRPTLVCGGAGCGKTLLGMEFVIHGITDFGEPGVFMSFEETEEELAQNMASLGFDLPALVRQKKLDIDYVRIERSEIEETGEYDLEGLFVRLGALIDELGAKRVVLDTIEALFAGLPNEAILRAELRRLFRWLKDRGVTTIITGERGDNTLTRYGLEEYVSDCVIVLDHRVREQIATRRLRVVKYRGSKHGTNECPVLIDEHGLCVLPISSLRLDYPVTQKRVSSGIQPLDAMLGGKGYYWGSSILVSGGAGSGKSSLATAFVDGICREGLKCVYVSFEESPDQVARNMASIGFDLNKWVKQGRLMFHSMRSTASGLEMHLANIVKMVQQFHPDGIVIDPVTNLISVGKGEEIKEMLTRVIDYLKSKSITSLFTSLTLADSPAEQSEVGISSLMDTWLLLRIIESANERNRILYVLKSRGMAHSNQMREFLLTDNGIKLCNPYLGAGAVLTGSARLVQETKDREQMLKEQQSVDHRCRELAAERLTLEAQMEALKLRRIALQEESKLAETDAQLHQEQTRQDQKQLSISRKAD
ncbi:MAG: circadian clock protein KaiC [Candidatus Omnitrophica bacterium]|nr:circadian clock protein KaiC [Candidatus Omnitrophota bacterium]